MNTSRKQDERIAVAYGWMYNVDRDGNVFWRHDGLGVPPTPEGPNCPPRFAAQLAALAHPPSPPLEARHVEAVGDRRPDGSGVVKVTP